MLNDGSAESLTKKERLTLGRDRDKMDKVLGGISQLGRVPAALFIIDIGHEHIALAEARRLGITTFGMVDTNCDPNKVDFAIPANDDATKSIAIITQYIMRTSGILLLNFEEVRRRSIMIWKSLPAEFYGWRPDKDAESFIEVIRHVLSCEHLFHARIVHRGHPEYYTSPWANRPLDNVADELAFASRYRNEFLSMVNEFTEEDLNGVEIAMSKDGTQIRKLGDYLLRAAYHESVHAGEFLANLMSLGVDRPYIWD